VDGTVTKTGWSIPDGFSKSGDRMWQDACPTCKTDEYLMDVEGGD
jgi:hypothetical protein